MDDVGVPLELSTPQTSQVPGLFVSQISPNAWRVFIVMEVLYGAMSNGARSLTVQEFLHCYCLDEIDKSKGMYSFVPRKSILKVICETPDSNRD